MYNIDITPRPTVAIIDLDALESNYAALRSFVDPCGIMGIVKANAYGHGLVACAKQLERSGVQALGVGFLEEGVKLRRCGVRSPILVLGGIFEGQLRHFLDFELEMTASSQDKLAAIDAAAAASGTRAKVHLKIDTGMNRIGVRPQSAEALVEAACKARNCEVVGVFSHLATADELELSAAREQIEAFSGLHAALSRKLPGARWHLANSAAMLRLPESRFDQVRPGISLYGVDPAPGLSLPIELAPVMKLQSRVVYFKVIHAGAGVSYGHRWRAQRQTRIVTLPLGYGDGYTRHYSNCAQVLIRGKRYPVVGSVCMDQLMVDIGDGEAYNGDEVVLIGSQGSERVTAAELAELSGTVPHEVTTAINSRVPRTYVRGGKRLSEEQV